VNLAPEKMEKKKEEKLKFDGDVGPCSDCGSHVNVNSEAPNCSPKVLCPQCQGDYLHKDKVNDALDEIYHDIDGAEDKVIQIKKELGIEHKLFGMDIKIDPDLKENEFHLS